MATHETVRFQVEREAMERFFEGQNTAGMTEAEMEAEYSRYLAILEEDGDEERAWDRWCAGEGR